MYRRLSSHLSRACIRPRITFPQTRPFALSLSRQNAGTDSSSEQKHSMHKVREGDTYNIQENSMKSGIDSAKKQGTGGHATEQRDTAGGKEKAKREHPEAPDPAIGMQDERGGKGG